MTIGVFDSGIGGLSVANAIKHALPEHEIIFKNDAAHMPYGTKSMDEVLAFCLPVLESLVEEGVDCIVIACNTVGTNLIEILRKILTVPLVSVEPMIKPASEITKSDVVAVCATPATLASQRYNELKQKFAANIKVLEPDCSGWAYMIEKNEVDDQEIAAQIDSALEQKADVIVLGCTHYHWIEEKIKTMVGDKAIVLQPEPAIVEQVERVLTEIRQRL